MTLYHILEAYHTTYNTVSKTKSIPSNAYLFEHATPHLRASIGILAARSAFMELDGKHGFKVVKIPYSNSKNPDSCHIALVHESLPNTYILRLSKSRDLLKSAFHKNLICHNDFPEKQLSLLEEPSSYNGIRVIYVDFGNESRPDCIFWTADRLGHKKQWKLDLSQYLPEAQNSINGMDLPQPKDLERLFA